MKQLAPLLAQASSIAPKVDALFWSMVGLCGSVAIAVIITIVFYSIRYRRGHDVERGGPSQSLRVELVWTLVPLALFMGVFGWSLYLFAEMRTPPPGSQTIYVVAKQWMWTLQHGGGQREINMLHVPLGEPILLTMTSQDAIHSFYVPAFRVKQDVLPGRYTQLWFKATQLGRFPLFCAEYCGLDHARMGGYVVVMTRPEFAKWLAGQSGAQDLAAQGGAVFRSRGCSGCHGTDSPVRSPSLDGLYGRAVHLSDGRTLIADDNYIRDSILVPNKDIVAGFEPQMPSFAGQLTEHDLLALIAYLKSTSAGGDESAAPALESSREYD